MVVGARRFGAVALTVALVVVAGACSGADKAKPTPPPSLATGERYYVSIGDSYASGYQPLASADGEPNRNGFAYLVPGLAVAKGYHLRLVNFACAGATTESMLDGSGCPRGNEAADGPSYQGQSQVDAATEFMREHRSEVDVVTVSAGYNDLNSCEKQTCTPSELDDLEDRLDDLVSHLRAAAGGRTQIIGLTYPDVILASYLRPAAQAKSFAKSSVATFRDVINPMFKKAYEDHGATFVDVTEGTDAYVPFTRTTAVRGKGQLPVAVAELCKVTFACASGGDPHPTNAGHKLIAALIVEALPQR